MIILCVFWCFLLFLCVHQVYNHDCYFKCHNTILPFFSRQIVCFCSSYFVLPRTLLCFHILCFIVQFHLLQHLSFLHFLLSLLLYHVNFVNFAYRIVNIMLHCNGIDLHFSSRLSFFCEYLIILAQRGKNRSGD